jgi:tetratricopeptide (TPR) repeat protein
MASKRSKKVRNRRKTLQRWRQRAATTRRPLSQIPPENADQVAMTTTGELLQLIRLHYEVSDVEQLRARFASLRCLEYDASQTRWVWLYTEEARTLPFKDRRASKDVVLGEFVFKGQTDVVLNLRSFERATNALTFFDTYIPRTVAHVTAMTVSNRLLSTAEAASLGSLDQYFDHAEVVVTDPASLLHDVEELVARTPDLHERFARLDQYLTDRAQAPVSALERLPVHYYEDGIRAVEGLLGMRQVRAMHHWQGDTSYTYQDMIREMLRQGESPPGHPRRVVQEQPSGETPLSTQLGALMRSEAYEDWLHAWELLRDHPPDHITTFDALERVFHLDVQDCSVTEMLYELDMALHNEGLEDARLTATRAEVARWVYTHFTEESALNLGNFRGYEAESLWELGQREQAEALFQELTELFPTFAWGYIWWGDQYWMSDWSYEHAPDYARAEAIYRQALAIPHLEDRGDVQDRLDDLADERAHPEKRARIQQTRLQHIQRRKSLNETP